MLRNEQVLASLLATGLLAGAAEAQDQAAPGPAPTAPPGATAPAERTPTPAPTAPAAAPVTPATPQAAGLGEITQRARVEALRAQLESARNSAEISRARFEAGLSPAGDAEEAAARVRVLEAALKAEEARLQREDRLVALERPLNLRLTDASLRQAAIALSEAAGLPVVVDEGVSGDKRLTLDARGVTLGVLLETLAEKSDLMIAPDERGVRIQRWPVLEVDGRQVIRRGMMAPWSDEWLQYLPAHSNTLRLAQGAQPTLPVPVAPGAPAPPGTTPVRPATPSFRITPFPGIGGGAALAPVGDRNVVLSEPGVGENGQPGYWLTVYRLEGDRLRKLSSVFHPAQSPQPGAAGFLWTMPAPAMTLPFGFGGRHVRPARPAPELTPRPTQPPMRAVPAPAPK